ncbi:hypothetical protein Plhal304r1_c027g0090891 [Plasmopara halstedii]
MYCCICWACWQLVCMLHIIETPYVFAATKRINVVQTIRHLQ